MTLGPTAFAVVLWAAVLAVLGILAYQVYTLAVDAGWLDGGGDDGSGDDAGSSGIGDGG